MVLRYHWPGSNVFSDITSVAMLCKMDNWATNVCKDFTKQNWLHRNFSIL